VRSTIFREGNSSCPVVSVTPRRIRAGRRSTIRAHVQLFGQPVLSAFVRLRGAVSAGTITLATGDATFRVRPRRAGTIRVSATNVASECVERITVRPAPRPRRPRAAGAALAGRLSAR